MKRTLFAALTLSVAAATAQNTWTKKANAGTSARCEATGFAIGTKGYITTGATASTNYAKDLWEYDQTNNTWTQKAVFPGAGRIYAAGMSIGNKGYIGTGIVSSGAGNDFWEYDPIGNTWTQKALFGGGSTNTAVAWSIGNKGYMVTGSTYTQAFWEYDPNSNIWTQKANYTGAGRRNAAGFAMNGKGYVVGGNTAGTYYNDCYEYDQNTNTWSKKANFPANPMLDELVAFAIGNKGYAGTGRQQGGGATGVFYEYNQTTDTWSQVATFGGTARAFPVGFAIGSKGYIGTGWDGNYTVDFWEYSPSLALASNITTSTNIQCNGSCTGTASVSASGGVKPYTYSWSSGQSTSTVSALCAGAYTVTVNDAGGNSVSSTITITQPAAITVLTGASLAAVCAGSCSQLGTTATGGTGVYTYAWTPSAGLSATNIANPSACPSATTTYTLTLTDANGCTQLNSQNITVNPLPIVTYSQTPKTTCINFTSVALSTGNPSGGTYSGTGVSGNNFNPSSAGIGTHVITYTYTDGNNCVNTDTSSITVSACTGIEPQGWEKSVLISPNPSKGNSTLSLTLNSSCHLNIVLFNLLGEKVMEVENSQASGNYSKELSLEHLPKGTYLLAIKAGERISSQRITKE